jgi:hypothetical protein
MSRFATYASLAAVVALTACQQPLPTPMAPSEAHAGGRADLVCKDPPPDEEILLPIAPRSRRVDLGTPVFTNPTKVTNPLFPIASLSHVVLTGLVDGANFRAETTLLPATTTIDLGTSKVEVLVSQYVAYLDGRIHETALDWYGQADDGSVWYFGEDVSNYEAGKIADKHGTWLTCEDGPAAMIMPARPKIGDVFRVENIYPLVFEEVEVIETGLTLPGPLGPVPGSIRVRQLHLDGSYAPKDFAPGYGEFSTGSGADIEAVAVALPANAATGPAPKALLDLVEDASDVFEKVGKGAWRDAGRLGSRIREAGTKLASGQVPVRLVPLLASAVDQLIAAVGQRGEDEARQAAIEVERYGLDVLVRFQARVSIDHARIAMFSRQLILDAQAEDLPGVTGDLAVIDIILDRLVGVPGEDKTVRAVRGLVAKARTAGERGDLGQVVKLAERLDEAVDD